MPKLVMISPEQFDKIVQYVINHPPSFNEIEKAMEIKKIFTEVEVRDIIEDVPKE